MVRHARLGLVLLALAALPVAVPAAAAEKWLHVRVVESGDEPETVRINLPLSLVKSLIAALPAEKLREGKIHVEGMKLDEKQRKAVLDSVRSTPDGEFVTVEAPDESVRIWKSGGTLFVQVRQRGQAEETVDIRVPLRLVEGLFAPEPGTLDLLALIEGLEEHGEGDIVTVKDRTSDVRIWLDSRSSAD